MRDFIKRSIKEMVGFWGVPKMRNPAMEAPGLEMIDFIKRGIKEMVGLWGGAQNEKSGPGGARAGNDRFLRGAQNEKSGPGGAYILYIIYYIICYILYSI